MKSTLLELTQNILSDMDSDEVNSINDTVESLQVAFVIRNTYNNIIDGKDWPWLYKLFKLDASNDLTRPTHMKLPEDITWVKEIRYDRSKLGDTRTRYEWVEYKTPEEFLYLLDGRISDDVNTLVVDDGVNIPLNILSNRAPSFYTSFDDSYIVFDSYDSSVDNTLQNSKTKAIGKRAPTFDMVDEFIPDMPTQMFSYLLNESKSTAFLTLKQMANQKAEQHSVSQRRRMSQEGWKLKNGITYPNYGRKSTSTSTGRYPDWEN